MKEEVLKKVSDLLGVAQEFITVENAKDIYNKIIEAQVQGNIWNILAFGIWVVISVIAALIIMKAFDKADDLDGKSYHSGGYWVTLTITIIIDLIVLVCMIPSFKAVYMWSSYPEVMFINWVR